MDVKSSISSRIWRVYVRIQIISVGHRITTARRVGGGGLDPSIRLPSRVPCSNDSLAHEALCTAEFQLGNRFVGEIGSTSVL